jgi:hypothetical protein
MKTFSASDSQVEPGIDFYQNTDGTLCLAGWGMELEKVNVHPDVVPNSYKTFYHGRPARPSSHPVALHLSFSTDANGTVTLLPASTENGYASENAIVFVRLHSTFLPGLFHLECTDRQRRDLQIGIDTSQVQVLAQNRSKTRRPEAAIFLLVMSPGSEVHLSTTLSPKRNWFMTKLLGPAQETLLERRCLRYDGSTVTMSKPTWLSKEGLDASYRNHLIQELFKELDEEHSDGCKVKL